MKKLLAIAAFLLASSAAQAQYTFDYGGRTIRIDPDRGTVQIPGVYDNTPKAKRSRNEDGDRDRPRKQSPQQAKTDSRTQPDTVAPAAPAPAAPLPAEQAAAPAAPAPVPATPAPVAPAEPSAVAVAPAADPATVPAAPLPPSAPAPQVQQEPPPAPKPAPAVAAVTPLPAPPPAAPQAANSPLGVWLTEEKEGKVRIEQCGANLCGYSVDKKSNRNGEQVLINMKPGKDNKWSGRIFDPNSGSTYDSTLAMKGSDSLRVQGCAFGGMFCGGQTWTRVN
ncbi:DUF2147 domain-containing protein [Bradyrhizobium sp. JYMT SZCCT0428]|uniref:DUF2147 domain-containing protein n=1 Tax=Bradyrhizobium sp. JYMT SZCCT0428 TaxID=2807673 RepID=UPI001BA4DCE9|nr:DUF2147 domain-containing protein [Bradyrhizobium sp. JYMT SZCCT0428]MBR1149356.1 DUF2147 domain-containing protein [Bradyrhizobium sp. JYMT SZCCT0428]